MQIEFHCIIASKVKDAGMTFSVWTLLGLIIAFPGAAWASIQVFNYCFGPQPTAPGTLNAIASSGRKPEEERVLVQFDMARWMWPGTLENKISVILRGVPASLQMPLLMFPKFVVERAQKRYELWTGLAGLLLSLSITPFLALGLALFQVGITAKSILVTSAMVIAVVAPASVMLRWGFKAKRISRCAASFAELQKENGLRLGFEWTAMKSLEK